MAAYVAKKPCKFAGKSYLIGDSIPDGVVLPARAGALLSMGYIAEAPKKARRKKKVEPASAPQVDDDEIPF